MGLVFALMFAGRMLSRRVDGPVGQFLASFGWSWMALAMDVAHLGREGVDERQLKELHVRSTALQPT